MFSDIFEQYFVEPMPLFVRRWYYSRTWGKNISKDLIILNDSAKLKRRIGALSDAELEQYIKL